MDLPSGRMRDEIEAILQQSDHLLGGRGGPVLDAAQVLRREKAERLLQAFVMNAANTKSFSAETIALLRQRLPETAHRIARVQELVYAAQSGEAFASTYATGLGIALVLTNDPHGPEPTWASVHKIALAFTWGALTQGGTG